MKKTWLITLVALTLALVAITGAGFALAGNGSDNDDQDVADEWKLVEAPGGPGGFSLRLPQGWQLNELQGIDSYVGEIVGGGARLTFDYGWYSSSLAEVDDDEPQYIVTYEEIGGLRAKLVLPRAEGEGLFTGVYFEDFDGGNLDIPSQMRLQITGVRLTPDQQKAALAVIRTIRPLASESQGEPEPSGDQPTATSIDDIDPDLCNWVHNINACFSNGHIPADIPMEEYTTVLWLAREDLSRRLSLDIGSIVLAQIERAGWPVYWPEEPEPGVAYIDIALAGFRMVLEADGQTYRYETDMSERVVFVG